jgi:alanine racemase
LRELQTVSGIEVAPVLKSNAYGHGLLEVAKILDREKVPLLVVDSLYEARTLRHAGIHAPLLTIGYVRPEQVLQSSLRNIAYTLVDLEQIKTVAKLLRQPKLFHLKIDTGMHRQGIMPNQIDLVTKIFRANQNMLLEGVCSHLADADVADSAHTKRQVALWGSVVAQVESALGEIRYKHLAASAGLNHTAHTSLLRAGLGLYGIDLRSPADKKLRPLNLKPALELRTVVSSIRDVAPGESVGYNATFTAKKTTRIATIPVGYFEGVDRRLSNKGFFVIQGQPCQILGRVSMNITTVDVSHLPEILPGETVTVISADTSAKNSLAKIAGQCDTIPYEILVHIPAHLRRVIV